MFWRYIRIFLKYIRSIVVYQKIEIQTQIYAMQLRAISKLKVIHAAMTEGETKVISSTGHVVKMGKTLYIYSGEEGKGGILSTGSSPIAKLSKITAWKLEDTYVKNSVEFRKVLKFWRDLLVNID